LIINPFLCRVKTYPNKYITITPTKDGKLIVILPRDLIDYKVAGGKDDKFQVNINAKPISTYQEISSNQTTRGLKINFGKDDRVIEIVGTQMGQRIKKEISTRYL
jgi:hypothetical protein